MAVAVCLPRGGKKQYLANVFGHSIEIANHSVRYNKITTLWPFPSDITSFNNRRCAAAGFAEAILSSFVGVQDLATGLLQNWIITCVQNKSLASRCAMDILPKNGKSTESRLKKTTVATCCSRMERLVGHPAVQIGFRDSIAIRITCENES